MKLILQKEKLLDKILLASRFISSKFGSVTALQSILLKCEDNTLHFFSTNLSSYFHTTIKIEEKEKFEALIEPRKAIDFLSLVPSGKIEVEIDEKTIFFHQGKIKGRFPLVKKEDFPLPPEMKDRGEVITTEFLSKNLPFVLFSAAKDETRPALSGVSFSVVDERLYIVATDGFRLSLMKLKRGGGLPAMIIPADFLLEIIKNLKTEKETTFTHSLEEKTVMFKIGDNFFYSRLIEGEFPPFEKVIPQEKKTTVTLDKDELLRNIKLISVFARDYSSIIICQFRENELIITPKTDGKEDNSTSQEVQLVGEEQKVAFNYKFLLDFLNNAESKKIIIEILRSDAPVVFKQENNSDFLHIIMPVRTQE